MCRKVTASTLNSRAGTPILILNSILDYTPVIDQAKIQDNFRSPPSFPEKPERFV